MTKNEPWTPDSVALVAEALLGPTWQSRLAVAITVMTGVEFPSVRIRHWFLEKNSRPIPGWLQPKLAEIFMPALLAHDLDREVAVRELRLRRGATNWPEGVSP